jgi:hypothetical protein
VIELYAITDHPGPELPGIAPLRVVARGGLGIVCGPATEASEVTPDELWRHERVVEALMRDRDLLPVRYGMRVGDEREAAHALEERQAELAGALERVRGAVEVSVRALRADHDRNSGDAESGSEYLRTRARTAAAAGNLHEPLSAAARMSARRAPGMPDELLRAAYLVDRTKLEAFTALVRDLDEANPDVQVLCTGPWPPYSFVGR